MVVNARRAAAGDHAFLRVCRLFGERAVAGRRIAGGGDDADEGPRDGPSSSPMPRMKARCGARSMPSVVMRERNGRIGTLGLMNVGERGCNFPHCCGLFAAGPHLCRYRRTNGDDTLVGRDGIEKPQQHSEYRRGCGDAETS